MARGSSGSCRTRQETKYANSVAAQYNIVAGAAALNTVLKSRMRFQKSLAFGVVMITCTQTVFNWTASKAATMRKTGLGAEKTVPRPAGMTAVATL